VPNINEPLFDEPREHGGLHALFRVGDPVDHYDGERPPPQ
jgi:hypothetical protein